MTDTNYKPYKMIKFDFVSSPNFVWWQSVCADKNFIYIAVSGLTFDEQYIKVIDYNGHELYEIKLDDISIHEIESLAKIGDTIYVANANSDYKSGNIFKLVAKEYEDINDIAFLFEENLNNYSFANPNLPTLPSDTTKNWKLVYVNGVLDWIEDN